MIKIWTDGSCPENSKGKGIGGWAVIIEENGEYQEYSGAINEATNNIAELVAAIEGLKKTKIGAEIEVICDSNYVIKGMAEWIVNWKKNKWLMLSEDGTKWIPRPNKELWQQLDKEASCRKVTWTWVRGHNNHPQNERCDYLAGMEVKKIKKQN